TLSSYYSHVQPRILLSFPTRRSSDLGDCAGHVVRVDLERDRIGPSRLAQDPLLGPGHEDRSIRPSLRAGPGVDHMRREGPIRSRSEEHTSELQSCFDLVCRLLLEKKK